MPIRVLVVDDSILMRAKLTEMIEREGDLLVVGTARNGLEALAMIQQLAPDVVTLDVEMPKLDGIAALARIMGECPVRVIVVTGHATYSGEETVRALELGAIDYVFKPSGSLSLDIERIEQELREKIRLAMRVELQRLQPIPKAKPAAVPDQLMPERIIVIGASTGGPRSLYAILPQLERALPAAVIIVQHMPAPFTASFAEHLKSALAWEVTEVCKRMELRSGQMFVAPGGQHVNLLQQGMRAYAEPIPADRAPGYFVPSISFTMKKAAEIFGPRCIGVVITGMGDDGVEGMLEIRRRGGRTIAESEESAIVFGMPRMAIERGAAEVVCPLNGIAAAITRILREGS